MTPSPLALSRPFAQVLAAIELLVIATIAASTVARRLPAPFRAERGAAIEPVESRSVTGSSDAVPVR